MTVLITADFYSDFELVKVDNIEQAESYIKSCIEENDNIPEIEILASSNNMIADDAIKQADTILFMTDYIND